MVRDCQNFKAFKSVTRLITISNLRHQNLGLGFEVAVYALSVRLGYRHKTPMVLQAWSAAPGV